MKNYIISLIFILFILKSCVEPYDHNITEFNQGLVVQGLITNEPGPYQVILSRAIGINSDTLKFEEDAIVTIIDINENIEILNEQTPGHYYTSNSFVVQVDNEYILKIITTDNKEYISAPVKLIKGPEIDSIYTSYSENYNFDENKVLKGIDILVDSKKWNFNRNDNFYLKWDYEETWEVRQKWNGRKVKWSDYDDIEYFPYDNTPKFCWNIKPSYDIILANPNDYSSDYIKRKKILHINELETKPFYGYSILINQYVINEYAYNFWNIIKENNIENGSVFDNIPSNAKSNIECCNSDEEVYGYFDAVYKTNKRLSFKPPIHGISFKDINEKCIYKEWSISTFLDSLRNITVWGLEVNETNFSIRFTTHQFCTDCLVVTNSDQEPDYWIYK